LDESSAALEEFDGKDIGGNSANDQRRESGYAGLDKSIAAQKEWT